MAGLAPLSRGGDCSRNGKGVNIGHREEARSPLTDRRGPFGGRDSLTNGRRSHELA